MSASASASACRTVRSRWAARYQSKEPPTANSAIAATPTLSVAELGLRIAASSASSSDSSSGSDVAADLAPRRRGGGSWSSGGSS